MTLNEPVQNLIMIAFINKPQMYYWLDEKYILNLLDERKKKISSFNDLDDFEIVNENFDDFN
jgi:hypothetical protein